MDDSKAIFFQTDRRWSGQKLGNSGLTIGGYGCTITSLARICFLMTGVIYNPGEIAKKISFTPDGLLIWESVQNIGLKATRTRGNPTAEFLTQNAGKMIVGLWGIPPKHWMTAEGVGPFGGVNAMDPMKADFVSIKQSEITSYTIFEPLKKPIEKPIVIDPVPDWQRVAGEMSAKEVWEKAKASGMVSKSTKFNDQITAGQMMIYFERAGLLKDKL